MTKNLYFNKQRFVYNLNLMVQYGWEPEIDFECKDGKTRGIVAYSGWIDIFDENNKFLKRVQDVNELFDVISAKNIITAIDDCGLNYSEDLSDRMVIEDGQLYLTSKTR